MIPDRGEVLEFLGTIKDPEINKDIISLNFVSELTLSENKIALTVSISNPAMHARRKMHDAIINGFKEKFGQVEVELVIKALPAAQTKARRRVLPDVKNVIAISSGKGGVGKSTVTANLAGGLAKRGYKVGIIDADIYGPSMPTMFDVVGERPFMIDVEGKSMIQPVKTKYGVDLLSIGFFTEQDNAVVWRGPMASKALNQMITEAHWGDLDYLLIDLPPGTGDIHLSLVQTAPLDGAVIVSTPQEVALADARKGINMFRLDSINVPIAGIVENMSWFTPEELPDNRYYIFGRDGAKNLAHGSNVPFLGYLPLIQSIREAGDIGFPAVFQENSLLLSYIDEMVDKLLVSIEECKESKKAQHAE